MRFEKADNKYTIEIQDFTLELVSFICKEQEFRRALITDDSRLSDFRFFNPKNAYKEECGYYFFKVKYYERNKARKKFNKSFLKLTREEKESLIVEEDVLYHKCTLFTDEEIVNRVNKEYNSNIKLEDLDLKIYELAYKVKQKNVQ